MQGSSAGGVGRHVARLAAGLVAAAHDVVVAAPAAAREDFDLDSTGAGFEAVDVSDRPRPGHDALAVRRLRRLLRDADVVHAHGLRAGGLVALALGPVLLSRRDGPRFVVTLHNIPVGGGAVAAATRVLERLVANRADVVLGVSGDLVDRMRKLGATAAERALVPAPEGPGPRREAGDVRAELGVEPGTRLLVTVARLAPQKGLDLLLDAVTQVGGDHRVLAVVAGDGPLREPLQQRVDADGLPVRLLGRRSDAPDLMRAADVVVVPSVWEGQPLVVQEALRVGAPIVATDVGGTGEVSGPAAVLVPYGDPAALAAAVRSLLDDDARRLALSAAARQRADALPSDADALAQVLRLYDGV
ncbi:MAG TPA: glycosyltransferase family 4 protein [Nocardioidaceae bacterium]|nr:glycosyltransferase family 4 protein [Nocardioidaceae bacterium]